MLEFLISNLFMFWALFCVLVIPRVAGHPLIGAVLAALSGVVVLIFLHSFGHRGWTVGMWAVYGALVLLISLSIAWRIQQTKAIPGVIAPGRSMGKVLGQIKEIAFCWAPFALAAYLCFSTLNHI